MTWRGPWGPEADELVAQLSARGVRLRLDGERLVLDAPRGVLTEAELEQLRGRRLDLIAYLQGDRSRGIRRLPRGRVACRVQVPPEEPPEFAITE